MRYADMEAWVRRRLVDSGTQPRFDSADIRTALNVGAQQVQAVVEEVAPDAFEREYRTNVLTNEPAYQLPRGFLRPKTVLLDMTGEGVLEATHKPISWFRTPKGTNYMDQYGGYHYGISGGVLRVFPVPDRDVEDGLQLWYAPSLEMAEDDDDLEAQGLVAPLHIAVVLWGVKLLMPEDGEPQDAIDAEIGKIQARIPSLYGGAFQAPEIIEVDGVPEKY
jgi:hypothetical protein